jgi:cyclopropane fatty-acyl-phospholipid synthase-like methyltransferase
LNFQESGFDFIIMGEVLEHVNNAPDFMLRTKKLLNRGGSIYLSTCANSPALDHVYHFKSADEIRDLITSHGFRIVKDLALPAEDVPQERWASELTTINYCALLEHTDA